MKKEACDLDRREELLKSLGARADIALIGPMVDEVVFLENQLETLKKLPFIKVHPTNPELQKGTPAARLYTQLSALYNAAMRTLVSLSGDDTTTDESPLRKWAKDYANQRAQNLDP